MFTPFAPLSCCSTTNVDVALLLVQKWDSRLKSDDTPVTKADLMADGLIREGLLKAYPDVPM